jgi:biopolymer transport protein ExbB
MGFFQLYEQGGPVILLIIACSIVALAVFLERLFYLRGTYHIPEETEAHLKQLSPQNLADFTDHCRVAGRPFHALVLKVIEHKDLPPDQIQDRIVTQLHQAQKTFEKYSDVLATIASISPLLGLLGTVTGMMHVFETINNQGLGNPNLLAGGISEALVTTIAGLLVAIPSFIAYKFISARATYLTERIEKYLNTVYETIHQN